MEDDTPPSGDHTVDVLTAEAVGAVVGDLYLNRQERGFSFPSLSTGQSSYFSDTYVPEWGSSVLNPRASSFVPASAVHARSVGAQDPTHNTESLFNIHEPSTRRLFSELGQRLGEIERMFETTSHASEPSSETKELLSLHVTPITTNLQRLRDELTKRFESYVVTKRKCDNVVARVKSMRQLLSQLEVPPDDTCTDIETSHVKSICDSMSSVISAYGVEDNSLAEARDTYWNEICAIRDACVEITGMCTSIPCTTCFNNECDTALQCGHVYCSKCCSQFHNCPACRQPVIKRTRLYFS